MGYSGRYHAASLAAVFVALAVGILIGVGFASDIVTGTAESIEESLGSDLTDARERIGELEAELERERDLVQRLFPAIAGPRLIGERVAIVALGGLPEEISGAVDAAIDPTGATLAEIAVVGLPPDADELTETMLGEAAGRDGDGEALERAARRAGRALGTGRGPFDEARAALLARYSGDPGLVNGAVIFRLLPDDLDEDEVEEIERLEAGVVAGLRLAGATLVGIERTDESTSSIEAFQEHGIASVDNVDTLAGRLALVFALDGAGGSFGVKDTADRLLPDLLPPVARPARGQ